MGQEYETKEVTKTETLYKVYISDPLNNEIVITWHKDKPFKVNSTLESALELLKKSQNYFLAQYREDLRQAEERLKVAQEGIKKWENLVNTEPKVVDKTK